MKNFFAFKNTTNYAHQQHWNSYVCANTTICVAGFLAMAFINDHFKNKKYFP